MKTGIHPDFRKYKVLKPPLNPVMVPVANFFLTKVFYKTPVCSDLTQTVHTIESFDGGSIRLTVISPEKCDAAMPALVYFHGGAFTMQASPHMKRLAAQYAQKTPCKVLLADYRLLPKATYPMGLEDCLSAYRWAIENADKLGIDTNHIAVGGDSAGGALAIGVCLLAHERGLPKPCFQLLVYPVTDEKQNTPSMKEFADTPLWNSKLNAKMWRMYLKGVSPAKRITASPADATSFAGIPPTYIEVAEYDCLRDEGISFAKALQESGIAAELYQTKGTVHGYEIAKRSEIVVDSVEKRIEKLQKEFYNR